MSETSASTQTDALAAAQEGAGGKTTILVYSDDSKTRSEVRASVGRRAAKGMPEITWKEVATPDALMLEVRQGGCSLMILDAEAPKIGWRDGPGRLELSHTPSIRASFRRRSPSC